MTFNEFKTEIKDRLGLRTTDADTRIGRAINRHYKRITTELGIAPVTRRLSVSTTATISSQYVTVSGVEKVERVNLVSGGTETPLAEVIYDEIAKVAPTTSDPTKYAIYDVTDNDVVIVLDCTAQSAHSLRVDAFAVVATLSGTDVPAFPESFHDILVEFVLDDELRKKGGSDNLAEADRHQADAQRLMSKLRLWNAQSVRLSRRQGMAESDNGRGSGGSGGASGAESYTQTGLVTFDRDPSAPFAVTDGSAYVANLFAEGVGNLGTNKLVGRDTAGTGESEEIGVTNGLEFTGSQSIGIADDGVTYARMQNVSAAARLLGRGGAGGSGNVEELTVGADFTLPATALKIAGRYNVKDYGATGDGVTDDYAAFQAVADLLEVSGGEMYVPAGTYLLNTRVAFTPTTGSDNDRDIAVVMHNDATIQVTATTGAFEFNGATKRIGTGHTGRRTGVFGGRIWRSIATYTTATLVQFTSTDGATISDCELRSGTIAVEFNNCYSGMVADCFFAHNHTTIHVTGISIDIKILRNGIYDCDTNGIFIGTGGNLYCQIKGNYLETITGNSINADGTTSHELLVEGNFFNDNGAANTNELIIKTAGARVIGNSFTSPRAGADVGINLTSSSGGAVVVGNTCRGGTNYAIAWIYDDDGTAQIVGNYHDNGGGTAYTAATAGSHLAANRHFGPGLRYIGNSTSEGIIDARQPTGAEATASVMRVFAYSPAIELMDKDSAQNWHIGIDDNDSDALVIGKGYGPGQSVTPTIRIDKTTERVLLNAGQLGFPAGQNASTDANTLDDYEEGTWTPADGSGAALSLTVTSAQYVKVGQLVVATADVTYPVTANGSNAVISGLPFSSQNTAVSVYGSTLNYTNLTTYISWLVTTNAATLSAFNLAGAAYTNANLSTLVFRFTAIYRASA